MAAPQILTIDSAEFSFAPWDWPFARGRRAEIDAHFAKRRETTPDLWNGRVLLLRDHALDGVALRGSFFETDFASFLAWRDWGFPPAAATNCFSMGAIRSSDGAYLLGVMGEHTANAGRVYFPAGTPDPQDIVGTRVDLAGSVTRELAEETGLAAQEFMAQPGWTVVLVPSRVVLIKTLQSHATAAVLQERARAHLASEHKPELADVRMVARRREFDGAMPAFVTAFLERALPE